MLKMKDDIYVLIFEFLEEEEDRRRWKRARHVSLKTNKNAKEKRKSYSKKIQSFKQKIEQAPTEKEKDIAEFNLRQYILKRKENN